MSDDDVKWRPIPNWEGSYEVSSDGRVRSIDRYRTSSDGHRCQFIGRELQPSPISAAGYLRVHLCEGRHVDRTALVHQLVLEAFVGPRPGPGFDACHNNGIRHDNRLENLRWDTKSENHFDRVRHGTHTQASKSECPRGHLLVDPNLIPNRRHRACLSCSNASQRVRRRGGSAKSTPALLQRVSDEFYTKIMGGMANV